MRVIRRYYVDLPNFLDKIENQNELVRRAELREWEPGKFRLVTYFPKARKGEITHADIRIEDVEEALDYLEDCLDGVAGEGDYKIVFVEGNWPDE